MVAAMAKCSQIKLIGDTLTIAEATQACFLWGAVVHCVSWTQTLPLFLLQRIQAEEEHRKELAPWPTTKNRSMHDRMTPPRKLNSSIMNWQERMNQNNCLTWCTMKHMVGISIWWAVTSAFTEFPSLCYKWRRNQTRSFFHSSWFLCASAGKSDATVFHCLSWQST